MKSAWQTRDLVLQDFFSETREFKYQFTALICMKRATFHQHFSAWILQNGYLLLTQKNDFMKCFSQIINSSKNQRQILSSACFDHRHVIFAKTCNEITELCLLQI